VKQRRLRLTLTVMIRHEVDQRRLEVVAKSAALGAGAAEIATHETQGELLTQFLCRLRVTQCPEQVAKHRAGVALQERTLRA
jgi:hypothetical protein